MTAMRRDMRMLAFRLLTGAAAVSLFGPVSAQEGLERNNRRTESEQLDFLKDRGPRYDVRCAPQPKGPKASATDERTVMLTSVTVTGNTQLSNAVIGEVTAAYAGKRVSVEDLSSMRDEITQLYVCHGFVSSGAVLPAQDASDGQVDVQIVEGTIEAVEVQGIDSLDPAYVTDRFGVARNDIVNLRTLEERFRVMLDDPAIKQVDADLRPGKTQGTATIVLKVKESDRVVIQLAAANERSPSIGGDRGSVEAFVRNIAWSGDYLTAEAGITEGTYDGRLSYSVPLTADGLTVTTSADYSYAKAIEEPLTDLDILSESVAANVGLVYPVIRENTADQALKLALSAAVGFQHSETSLLGVPFSFSPGAVDGTTEYWSAVLGAQYSDRRGDSVFAAGFDVKLGLHAEEPTTPSALTPDPNFWVVAGRAQFAKRLDDVGTQLILRAEGQFADKPMFVPEKYAVGGLDSVRGYRKNRALGDTGVTASIELQRPLLATGLSDVRGRKDLSIFAFVDGAHVWNAGPTNEEIGRLWGAGGGIAWTPTEWASLRLTYADAIDDVPRPSEEFLQDKGFYFQVSVRPLDVFR